MPLFEAKEPCGRGEKIREKTGGLRPRKVRGAAEYFWTDSSESPVKNHTPRKRARDATVGGGVGGPRGA